MKLSFIQVMGIFFSTSFIQKIYKFVLFSFYLHISPKISIVHMNKSVLCCLFISTLPKPLHCACCRLNLGILPVCTNNFADVVSFSFLFLIVWLSPKILFYYLFHGFSWYLIKAAILKHLLESSDLNISCCWNCSLARNVKFSYIHDSYFL